MEYKILSQVVNINECDRVTVLKQRITAILTSGIWKGLPPPKKNGGERTTGLGDRRQCPVQVPSLYKSVDVVQFLHLKITLAMYSILNKRRALNLSLDIMLDLFDKMIFPVLLYASKVWGPGNNAVIERVHLMFCKYILGLKRSTPNCIVYRELGRYPVDIKIKTSIIASGVE